MWWLSLFFFLMGCAKLPRQEDLCSRMATPSLEKTRAEACQDVSFVIGDFPEKRWWHVFEDDQLSQFIERALENQPSLKGAEARLRTAEEMAAVQRASLFPMLGISAQSALQYFGKNSFFRAFAPIFPGQINEYTLELNFSYEFDFWGKNRNLLRAALGEAKAQAAELAGAEVLLSTAVALTYFNWQIEKRLYALLEEEEQLMAAKLQLTELRMKRALDDKQQHYLAKSDQIALTKQLIKTRQTLRLLETELKTLLGMGPDSTLPIYLRTLPKETQVSLPEELSSNLLAHRPDLRALIWRVEAAAERVGAARTDFYPSINLIGLIGLDSVFIRKLFSWDSRTALAKPALNLPLFTGGKLRAQLKARQAEFQQAIYAYNEQLLQAVREVADQIAILQMVSERLSRQEQIVDQKSAINELIQQRSTVGLSSRLEQIETQQMLLQEKRIELAELMQRLRAVVALIKALGGGYHQP